MEVLLLTEESRTGGGRWPLRILLLMMLAGVAALGVHFGTFWLGPPAAARAIGPSGLLVPSPNDSAWIDYYRSRREGVAMAVHLPSARGPDGLVVWEKYVEQGKALVALAEIHYDCQRHTRRSARMAVYRGGTLDGVAALPTGPSVVPVAADSVENDALALVCEGKTPAIVDDDS